ncbi:MAG: lysine 2,3-aminomutase [Actinobacteria bacterium]|nr:lysine 2,3-aminomutase [Actinomycetota bacterium]
MGVAKKAHQFRAYGKASIDQIPQLETWTARDRGRLRALAHVFPFRVNRYQLDELIDWNSVPDDPIFRLVFPQPEMLDERDLERIEQPMSRDALHESVRRIHRSLNPHPAGQLDLNAALLDGRPLPGIQHKYRETVLFFPKRGQTCPAYCTYCFRWPQFVGDDRIAATEVQPLIRYLRENPDVTDLLITGGDPFTMRARVLARYIQPILDQRPGGLTSIRIGTKVPATWPYRFISDRDTDELLKLLRRVVDAGFHLALMIHYTHPRELSTPAAVTAVGRLKETGAVLRSQSPIARHINDDPDIWASMWNRQVQLGIVPYYMFVARDTGARAYFELPLAQTHAIFFAAYRQVSGLGRTVRGPVMSTTPGKVMIHGTTRIGTQKAFSLSFLQARDPAWVGKPFLARYDPLATWFDNLKPLDGSFFFERLPEVERPHDTRPTIERRP